MSQVARPSEVVLKRSALSAVCLGALFLVALGSQAKLQALDAGTIQAKMEDNRRFFGERTDDAERGPILAADGRALAADEEAYVLQVNFAKVPRSDGFWVALAAATGIPASDFKSLADAGLKSRTWPEPIGKSEKEAVEEVRLRWKADGLSAARVARRDYPLGEAASGIVGLLRDDKAVLGLEKSQDERLRGVDGFRKGMTDKTGYFLPTRISDQSRPSRDGQPIRLTIDTELQRAASEAIRDAVEVNKAENGVAIVIEPKTGNLLAMANWPAFRPYGPDGRYAPIKPLEDFNPAISAQLDPGSTFKILTLAKALDTGAVQPSDTLYCSGIMHPTARTRVRCDLHHGTRAHRSVDLEAAIARSCNVAAATWAAKVGYESFVDYMRSLGLFRKTELGLPYERTGNFNFEEYNKTLQLANVGFGQSVTCTPVALAGAFAMLANGGVRMEPRLIDEIGTEKQPIRDGVPIVSPETAQRMLDYMEAVIESDSGTGKTLRIPGYRLGGKTGTAQKIGKGQDGYVSNFIGFVPSQSPKAVVLVMVNRPQAGNIYGALVAGPAFHAIAESVIRRYSLPATEPRS